MGKQPGELRIALDLLRAEWEGPAGLARRQERRFQALLRMARSRSIFYRNHYRDLPDEVSLRDLPPVTKPELMAAFDDWVTDPAVTGSGVEEFISNQSLIGTRYLSKYFVCTSSGTTGHPGLFVHDPLAINVYLSFTVRIDLHWLSLRQCVGLARKGLRWAVVVGTGAHYAAAGWMELQRRRSWWRRRAFRVFSVQRPIADLVSELNAFDPAILTAYPSTVELFAEEQVARRLRTHPVIIETGGESMDPTARARVAAVFDCPVRDVYGSSEADPVAFDCDYGWLHVCSDWMILEPVDADYQPTPPGQLSHTVLLSNLANHVQPIIRYDLGDAVLARPDPCPCGNPLPAIRVAGRCDDVLRLTATDGHQVVILPLAISSEIDESPGVHRSQLFQDGSAQLRLRLEPVAGAVGEKVWQDAFVRLHAYLSAQGLANVELARDDEPPAQSATSGKFRQVIAVKPRTNS